MLPAPHGSRQIGVNRAGFPLKSLHFILWTSTQSPMGSQTFLSRWGVTNRNYNVGRGGFKHNAEWVCAHRLKEHHVKLKPPPGSPLKDVALFLCSTLCPLTIGLFREYPLLFATTVTLLPYPPLGKGSPTDKLISSGDQSNPRT